MIVFIPTFEAGQPEAGEICACCRQIISVGEAVGRCPKCRHLQHAACWEQSGACCSNACYQGGVEICRPQVSALPEPAGEKIVITRGDTAGVQLLPSGCAAASAALRRPPALPKRLSVLAIIAFAVSILAATIASLGVAFPVLGASVSILGIPLLGVPCGMTAIILGAVAISGINVRRHLKGLPFAVSAVAVGVVAIAGWTTHAGLVYLKDGLPSFEREFPNSFSWEHIDPAVLDDMPPPIQRALRANVMVTSKNSSALSKGSGVVLQVRGGQVMIITNHHVITTSGGSRHVITFADGREAEGKVVWLGPDGIDIAVLSCTPGGILPEPVPVRAGRLIVGENVFAVGNPVGLGWSYCRGAVSAIRTQKFGSAVLRLIQTQTPLNPGNSGGGLYDEEGVLVGINQMTADKHRAEGIGFAIAINDIISHLEGQAGLSLRKQTPARKDVPPQ